VARRKATKSGSADDEGPTYLAPHFALADVGAVLDAQIAKGRDLLPDLNLRFPEPGEAVELSAKFWSWHNFNATYLERAFTTKELSDRYEGVAFVAVGGRDSDADRLRYLTGELQRDINHLVALRERLSLYEPPEPQPSPSAHAPPAAPARQAPINITIHGQVGQVNLADLIQRVDARIEQVDQRGEGDLATALKQLTDAIKAAGEAAADQRDDALDAVAVLAEVGVQPVEERAKLRGRVRGAISVIANLAEIAPVVKAAWGTVGPSIMEHLPRLK
jgi:hypothetical protein